MAWAEISTDRSRRGRSYEDEYNSDKGAWSGTPAALHYESILDSGVYDAEVDCTPQRVNNAQFNGWRITVSGWHYALGEDIANHGSDQDGWIGFGGRQGAHWFKFRLIRAGYLYWPDRIWDDIGGAPDYDRTNLSRTTYPMELPLGETVNVSGIAEWGDIWNTPGGGELSVKWLIDGFGLREDITINQEARNWIKNNRPPSTDYAASDIYFGFVFRADWSDVPKVYGQGLLQSVDNDFDDGGGAIELKDDSDKLLALMPIGKVRAVNTDNEILETQNLRKRFWRENGNHYILTGLRVDKLNSMPAGDLIFDPTTLDEQADSSSDDATEKEDFAPDTTNWAIYLGSYQGVPWQSAVRFQSVNIANGVTIDTSYLSFYTNDVTGTAPLLKVRGNDVDDSAAFDTDTANQIHNLDRTTAAVDWDDVSTGWDNSPEIKTITQEIVNRGGWAANNNMTYIVDDDGSASTDYARTYAYDGNSSYAAKLHIEYTAAAAGDEPIPLFVRHLATLRGE